MAANQATASNSWNKHKARRWTWNIVITILLLLFTAGVIIPFLWMVSMSLRTTGEILTDPYGLPTSFRIQNYWKLLFDPNIRFYRYFLNSAIVTAGALILTTLFATLGGYGFGRKRYDFKGRGVLFSFLLLSLMLPPQIQYIPQFTMMSRYGLLGTRWALILLYAAEAIAVSTFLMAAYFSRLPTELEEAARIDGCSELGIFWRVMLPLARPALATILLLNFIRFWNELLLAITMVPDPDKRTLPAAMMLFVGENAADFAMAATSVVMAMLPVLVLYLFLSDRFIEGMTAGALKG